MKWAFMTRTAQVSPARAAYAAVDAPWLPVEAIVIGQGADHAAALAAGIRATGGDALALVKGVAHGAINPIKAATEAS